jgi:UDPglucose 6-dehydrogenase
MTKRPRISVMGIGYVGLCTAVGFANKRNRVLASTHDADKASKINKGIAPFYEPGLQRLLKKAIEIGYLKCLFNQAETAVLETDITFIAVGTPSKPDGSIDLQHIKRSSQEIGEALRKKDTYHVIAVKSTVVPGTTQNIVEPILENRSKKQCGPDFGLCMNPEFLREGSAVKDTFNPDRIIIGEHDKASGDKLENLYTHFYGKKAPPTLRTNLPTAELIKYASNSLLATKISYINTIANICQETPSTDIKVVAEGIGLDKRIGPMFLNAGLGYGGSCFPKDVKALIAYSRNLGYRPELLEAVENVNEAQPHKAVGLIKKAVGDLNNKKISILGLSFKPHTDDMREARSIPLINQLLKEGASVTVYDPAAIPAAKAILKSRIEYAPSAIECLRNADCCILVTEWDEFKNLRPEDFSQNMRHPLLIDGRRIYPVEEYSQKLKFTAIGLNPSNQP